MMNKHTALAALAVFACSAALAQAPASTGVTPPSEVSPAASGGAAAANSQNKVETRKDQSNVAAPSQTGGYGKSAPVAELNPSASGGKAAATAGMRVDVRRADTNGDGMVSAAEWNAYHTNAWKSMKPGAKGVSTADMDKLNRMN